MAVLFQKDTTTRANFASWFVAKLIEKGWEQISSKVSTDGYVFHSTGNDGLSDYYFNIILDAYSAGTLARGTVSLIRSYTPGASGVAGTFVNKFNPVYQPPFAIYDIPLGTQFDVYYAIDKDRIRVCCCVSYATASSTLRTISGKPIVLPSSLIYFGKVSEDSLPNPSSNNNYGNVVFVQLSGNNGTALAEYATFYTPSYDLVSPSGLNVGTGALQKLVNPLNHVPGSKIIMSPIFVSNGSIEIGTLDGAYWVNYAANVQDGDLLTVGAEKYRVCVPHNNYGTYDRISFFAIRVV